MNDDATHDSYIPQHLYDKLHSVKEAANQTVREQEATIAALRAERDRYRQALEGFMGRSEVARQAINRLEHTDD